MGNINKTYGFKMALRSVVTDNSVDQSIWFDFKGKDGGVLARFKINPISVKQYQLSLSVAGQSEQPKLAISEITNETKVGSDLIVEAVAYHLITDWENVELSFDGGETFNLVEYSPENAIKLMLDGDVGGDVSDFIITESKNLYAENNKKKDERLGKSSNSTNTKRAESSTKSPKRIVKNNNSKSLE